MNSLPKRFRLLADFPELNWKAGEEYKTDPRIDRIDADGTLCFFFGHGACMYLKPDQWIDITAQCITLDVLIERLAKIRQGVPGDFHVHLCTEHRLLQGTQLQEAIVDVAVSDRTGVVILLAESFR